jgi:hypothetical protein
VREVILLFILTQDVIFETLDNETVEIFFFFLSPQRESCSVSTLGRNISCQLTMLDNSHLSVATKQTSHMSYRRIAYEKSADARRRRRRRRRRR